MPFFVPQKMKRAIASVAYSTSEGVWATGERMLFVIIDKPAEQGVAPTAMQMSSLFLFKRANLGPRLKGKERLSIRVELSIFLRTCFTVW